MKTCSKCKIEKPLTEFNKKGKGKLQTFCKECNSIYLKEHYQKNKQYYLDKAIKSNKKQREWFEDFKKTLKCEYCGENHVACLDFHHTDPSVKEFSVGSMIHRFGKARILKEVEKCTVLCSNCHRKLHWKEKQD